MVLYVQWSSSLMSDDDESRLRIGGHGGGTLWAVKNREGVFVMLDQVKIAERRGGVWVSLMPGWKVADALGGGHISVRYEFPGAEVIPFPRRPDDPA
jgi:hypothetical protein